MSDLHIDIMPHVVLRRDAGNHVASGDSKRVSSGGATWVSGLEVCAKTAPAVAHPTWLCAGASYREDTSELRGWVGAIAGDSFVHLREGYHFTVAASDYPHIAVITLEELDLTIYVGVTERKTYHESNVRPKHVGSVDYAALRADFERRQLTWFDAVRLRDFSPYPLEVSQRLRRVFRRLEQDHFIDTATYEKVKGMFDDARTDAWWRRHDQRRAFFLARSKNPGAPVTDDV